MMTMRVVWTSVLWLALFPGCGAGHASATGEGTALAATCQARTDAHALAEALEACHTAAESSESAWPVQASYDALFEQVRTHLGSAGDDGLDVTSAEVQPIADAIWAFLDELTFPTQAESLRTRAEEAAEGLLRDRGADVAPAAAQNAYEAVTSIRATLHPPGLDPCAELRTSAADARIHASQVCVD